MSLMCKQYLICSNNLEQKWHRDPFSDLFYLESFLTTKKISLSIQNVSIFSILKNELLLLFSTTAIIYIFIFSYWAIQLDLNKSSLEIIIPHHYRTNDAIVITSPNAVFIEICIESKAATYSWLISVLCMNGFMIKTMKWLITRLLLWNVRYDSKRF